MVCKENPIRMDDLGVPLFQETSNSQQNHQLHNLLLIFLSPFPKLLKSSYPQEAITCVFSGEADACGPDAKHGELAGLCVLVYVTGHFQRSHFFCPWGFPQMGVSMAVGPWGCPQNPGAGQREPVSLPEVTEGYMRALLPTPCRPLRANIAPRWANIAPRWVNIAPRWVNIAPRWVNIAPRRANIAPRWANIAPRWVNIAPRWPNIAPRWPNIAPRWVNIAPRWTNIALRWTNLTNGHRYRPVVLARSEALPQREKERRAAAYIPISSSTFVS